MSTQRNDAPESIFFARDLEYQESRVYETIFPAFKFREIFPVNNEGGEFVTTVSYRMYERSGIAKVLSDYANDWPLVDLAATETRIPVRKVGDAARFSDEEVGAAARNGVQLESRKLVEMRRAYEEKLDIIASSGDSSGLMGLNNNPYIPVVAPTVSAGSGDDTWPNKTPDEIVADISLLEQTILANTQGSHSATFALLSPARAVYLRTARLSNTNNTLLSYVQQAFPNITFMEWQRMATASAAGTQRLTLMERTPEVLEFLEPAPFRIRPLEHIPGSDVNMYRGAGKTGGVVVRRPLAIAHMDGI